MRSKTSCFNQTVFRKNLTRFAPVWGGYTLCLVVGILILYGNGGAMKQFHFAQNMTELVEIMAVVNLLYAPIVAQLLFGDLYSSRMCNMLHAFPLRRENWFLTHVVSGFAFSLVPTLVMAVLATPLLADSLFEGAVSLGWWIFLASNLQFVCFFGMAVFCVMVVGNRFTMLAAYGLLNAGAAIAWWLIDTVYTPMLYGIVTPTQLMNHLTPMYHMTNFPYIQTSANLYDLRELFGEQLKGAVATFTITENWWRLWMLAGVGLAFSLLGLVLYKIRNLECAGSAVAFPILRPVFEVLCAIFVAAAGQFFLYNFVSMNQEDYVMLMVLPVGLAVGWFIGKMLTAHTTRVFSLKSFCGLAALAAVFAVSLWLTHVDLMHIETRLPVAEKIKNVTFNGTVYTDREDIDNFLRLHAAALDQRAEEAGVYTLVNGEWVLGFADTDPKNPGNRYTYVDSCNLTYEMENGKLIKRRYRIWMDNEEVSSEAGRIAESYLTRWETINHRTVKVNGVEYNRLDLVLQDLKEIYVDYLEDQDLQKKLATESNARSLIAAIQADCADGNMAQNYMYHSGSFRMEDTYAEDGYRDFPELGISLSGDKYTWWISIYPDSVNTLRWLKTHGVLPVEVRSENIAW